MDIDVVLVTWPSHPKRIEYLRRTWDALTAKLTAKRHVLRYVVSSESQRDPDRTWCGDELEAMCEAAGTPLRWHEGPASLGAGMNAALCVCTAPVVFLVQDDFTLLKPLDLSDGAEAMEAHPEVDMIRYSYYLHPTNGTCFTGERLAGFRRVDLAGHWPYGDDPQLRTPRAVERHGWYTEGIGHAAEGDMLKRLVRGRATILAADECYFGHGGGVSSVPRGRRYAITR